MYEIEKQFIKLAKKQEKGTIEGTSSSIEAFSQYFKIFYSYVQKKCPHCDKMGKNIKKDGANKIFLISTVKEEKIERKKSRDITTTARGDSVHMINELTE